MRYPEIRLEQVARTYHGVRPVPALRDVTVRLTGGEVVALTGRSGSGKSTLLHILGLLDRPTAGRYLLDGRDLIDIGERARARLRASHVGFVFQQFHLVPYRTAAENVELALYPARLRRRERAERARASLARVRLDDRAHHYPAQLSGGEQQRVALARALVTDPLLLLCDEPTGNLDRQTGEEVVRLILGVRAPSRIVVLVTHDRELAGRADRTVTIVDGRLVPGGDAG